MILISLFYYFKKVFTRMNAWMIQNQWNIITRERRNTHLNMKDITDADFEITTLGEYHDLCVKSNTLLLVMFLATSEI